MPFSPADIDQLFIADTPLIDVRAPVEFLKGSFPTAVNLPILNDQEREQVGIRYTEDGPQAAESLGNELVSGDIRNCRIEAWQRTIGDHPDAVLYCFRGGQRSKIACDWLKQREISIPRVPGGYKQLRSHLLGVFERLPSLLVIAGKTGTGKTRFLAPFPDASIDLEGIARHRGSAFGGFIDPQPSQIDFENELAIEFLKRSKQPFVMLEDEGRLIGRIHLPLQLQEKMKQSPLLLIEESVSSRAERILDEYVVEQWQTYQNRFANEAEEKFAAYFLTAIDAIRKRLGNVAHAEVREQVLSALTTQQASGETSEHLVWIERLLTDYYDPMYEYQLEKKKHRIRAQGDHEELSQWLANQANMA